MDPEAAKGQKKPNIVWGGTDAAERPAAAGVNAQAPPRPQNAALTQDGQLVEAGYGHGV